MLTGSTMVGQVAGKVSHGLRGPRLIFWSMVVASLALSVGSFYTTWIGMMEFVGSDTIGVTISFVITFGVQSLLYAISWGIAQNWRFGGARLIGSVVMWLICGFISGFFSFYGFFNEQGGRDPLTRHLYVNAAVQTTVQGIADDLAARVEDRHRQMITSKEYTAWMSGGIERVIADSRNLEAAISETARRESNRLRTQIQENTLRIAALRDEQARTKRTLVTRETGIENLQTEIQQLEADIARLNQAIPNLVDQLTSLQVRKEQERRTGIGPRHRQVELDENTTLAALQSARDDLDRKTGRLAERRDELKDLEAVLQAGGVQSVVARFDLDIQRLEEENQLLAATIERLEPRRSFNADSETARVEAVRRAFENKDYDQYATLVDNCIELENIIKDSRPSGTVSINCRSQDVVQSIADLHQLKGDIARFQTECLDRLPVVTGDRIDPLIEAANGCLPRQPDPQKRATAFQAMTELKSKRGDGANPISAASVALFDDQQANAVMALILAIAVDLLVLICAIIGRHSGESERMRAIDLLFDQSRKYDDAGYEYLVTLPTEPNQRVIVNDLVNMLIRENLADFIDPSGKTVALRRGARDRLRQERDRESGDSLRHRPPASPPPATREAMATTPEAREAMRRGHSIRGDR